MADYVRVFETGNEDEVNDYISKGWDLIGTSKITKEDGDASYIKFSLGLSTKEYANRLLDIVKEYEKHGFKEAMINKVAVGQNDVIDWYDVKDEKSLSWYELTEMVPSKTPLANFITNYEHVVNDKNIICLPKDMGDDLPI